MSVIFDLKGRVLPCMPILSFLFILPVYAVNSYQGQVNMQGSILDTACAIATTDLAQTIEMGLTTVGEVVHNGGGEKHSFSFHFINCDLALNFPKSDSSNSSRFQTMFDGPAAGDLFRISGASGVGLEITDKAGNIVQPGKVITITPEEYANQRMDFNLRLVSNHDALRVGEYHAVLRYKVDYF